MFLRAILAASLALALATAPAARATTITFTTPDFVYLGAGSSYTESGYVFTGVSGTTFALEDDGNPTRSLWIGFNTPVSPTDTLSVTRADGGTFTLDSFDYAAFSQSFISDGATLLGYLDNVLVDSLVDLFATSSTFIIGFNPGLAGPIDELRIIGASVGNTSLMIDNIVLTATATPAPPAAALLPVALAGLALARRRRA